MDPDVENTCRLCLASGQTELTSIQQYIGTLCGIAPFSLDKRLPQRICLNCVAQVDIAALLRRRILEAESLWDRFITANEEEDKNRLCESAVESSPTEPEQPEFKVFDVRGGITDPLESLSPFQHNLEVQVKQESIDVQVKIEPEDPPPPQESNKEDAEMEDHSYFRCPFCNSSQSSQTLLRFHIVTNHWDLQSGVCMTCCRFFPSTEDEMSAHSEICKRVKCSVCKMELPNDKVLKHHLNSVHGEKTVQVEYRREGFRTGAEKLKCSYRGCAKKFHDPDALLEHMQFHDKNPTEEEMLAHMRVCKGVKCSICKMELPNHEVLKHHLNSVHGKESSLCSSEGFRTAGERKLKCSYRGCAEEFHDPNVLLEHMRLEHSNKKPFRCPHCPNKFATFPECTIHMLACTKRLIQKRRQRNNKSNNV